MSRLKPRVQVIFNDESLTKQEFKQDTDINSILARWQRDAILPHFNKYQGRYEDVSNVEDYRSSLETIMKAEEAFMSLPAKVRKRFDNDPGQFLDFVQREENLKEMVELGLAKASAVVDEVLPQDPVIPSEEPVVS